MSQETVTKVFQPEPYEVVTRTTCDICGYQTTDGDIWHIGDNDSAVTIRLEEINDTKPNIVTIIEYDICANCFRNYLMNYLYGFGAKARSKEEDGTPYTWMRREVETQDE